jgi:formylglycine-generating enzyme required for sulfatase activity
MQRTEVTVGQFKRFVKETGYQTEAEKSDGCWVQQPDGRWQRKSDCTWRTAGPWMTTKGAKIDLYPVTCVSWNDAMAFAQWLSRMEGKTYRLPTEAQWEMACRAGTQTPFAFGKCPDKRSANYAAAGKHYAHCSPSQAKNTLAPLPAASLKKNKWGLFDMHGNMAEWCWDWYDTYSSQAQSDPQGPVSGTERVIRGGHFISTADQCRSAKRSSFLPAEAANVIGFRLVQLP